MTAGLKCPPDTDPDRVDHHHDGDTEGQGDPEQVDALVAGVEDRGATAGEDENEGAEELRTESPDERFVHAAPSHRPTRFVRIMARMRLVRQVRDRRRRHIGTDRLVSRPVGMA